MTSLPANEESPCRMAVVTSQLGEAEAVAERMQGSVATRASGFVAHVGGIGGHRIVVAGGSRRAGGRSAVDVLEALLTAHRPELVVAGGPASGLAEPALRGALVLADEVVNEEGRRLAIGAAAWQPAGAASGPIVSLERPVRTVTEKRVLAEKYQAIAVDQESFALADVCAAEGLPFLAVRVITDSPEEELPKDIQFLLERKSAAAKAGALAGTLFRHPSHLKHLWRLQESALTAGEILAKWIVRLAQDLPAGRE